MEERLAELGSVPWVIGGDRNADPEEVQAAWSRPAVVVHTGNPTQKFGGNFDLYMHCPRRVLGEPKAEVVPGTDHIRVGIQLPGELHKLLGYRLVQPTPLNSVQLEHLKSPETRAKLEKALGVPPDDWGRWCAKVELALLRALGLSTRGNTGRGRVPRAKRQQMSRPQGGKQAIGTNPAIRALRLREARAHRLQALRDQGQAYSFEASVLQRLLGGGAQAMPSSGSHSGKVA